MYVKSGECFLQPQVPAASRLSVHSFVPPRGKHRSMKGGMRMHIQMSLLEQTRTWLAWERDKPTDMACRGTRETHRQSSPLCTERPGKGMKPKGEKNNCSSHLASPGALAKPVKRSIKTRSWNIQGQMGKTKPRVNCTRSSSKEELHLAVCQRAHRQGTP